MKKEPMLLFLIHTQSMVNSSLGVLLGMFLGVIGLIIGMCMYESDSVERKTFTKGWVIGFIITLCGSIVGTVLYFVGLGLLLA